MAVSGDVLPLRQFVLKVHSRCDLACDHCYVYEHADQSWRARPAVISPETVAMTAARIAEHASEHRLSVVRVILHGGEPLLAGASRLAAIARALRRAIEPVCELDLRIHTNGVRLDAEFCEMFLAEGIVVGISLDGDRAANDLHRRYRDGRSSYDQVLRAVGVLRQERYRHLFSGLLATIDIRSDPVAVYRALAELDPPNLDFLLPHGTWDAPPPGKRGPLSDGRLPVRGAGGPGAAPYAAWLAAVFGEWTRDGRRVPVRIFDSIIATTFGGLSGTEALGLAPSDVAVIETDGTIEQADSLKVAYDGAPVTGLDVYRDSLDAAAAHPAIRARQQGVAGLSPACRQCPVVESCGGGLYAHRYRTGSGFDNPSVYCADLETIINHVRARLRAATAVTATNAGPEGTERAARADRDRPLTLPWAHFDALAAGFGDAESISCLSGAQRSVQRTLLRLVRERATGGPDGMMTAGWDLLTRVDRAGPAAVTEVLAHPYVRAWAERCLRHGGSVASDGAHLASIAAAAAIRSGTLAELEVPVAGGCVHLPTLGRQHVGDARAATLTVDGAGAFQVRAACGKWHIETGASEHDRTWEPVRELHSAGFTVRLEDTDPYRDCHQWPVSPRLSAAQAAAWQAQFDQAWRLIQDGYPRYAAGIRAGLSVLVPLANEVTGREISAAAREAFGAVAAALPPAAADLALLIIHEFQHVKLGALYDLFDLCDRDDQRVFYAPWRKDPRPLTALLQGTYAHIGVTDYWRLRRHAVTGQDRAAAEEQFARWRMMTAEAIETLAGSGGLTPPGGRFVAGMRATVEPWLGEPVAGSAEIAARDWAAAQVAAWRQRQEPGQS